jgi:hypothetical protein
MAKQKINSKNKGNRGENELCKIFSERFSPIKFKRNVSSGSLFGGSNRIQAEGIDSGIVNALVGDIIVPPNFIFSIESKSYKEISFWDLFNKSSDLHQWFEQAEGDAEFSKRKPMIVAKFNNKQRICFLKDKLEGYVFEHMGWYCYWLSEILNQEDDFFLE